MPEPAQTAGNATRRRFLKFILVGLLNTAFGYAVYAVLLLAGLDPQPALATSFGIGVIWNYFTTARLVFDQGGFSRFPAYIVAYLLVYGANAAGLQGLLRAGLSPYVAQAILTPLAAVLAFVLISLALTGRIRARDETSPD